MTTTNPCPSGATQLIVPVSVPAMLIEPNTGGFFGVWSPRSSRVFGVGWNTALQCMQLHLAVYTHAATHDPVHLQRFAALSHLQRPGAAHLNMIFIGMGSVPNDGGMWYFYLEDDRYISLTSAGLVTACNTKANWMMQP